VLQPTRDGRWEHGLQPLLGGELWRHMRTQGTLLESEARFYIGCVVEALGYLHARQVPMRPEACRLRHRWRHPGTFLCCCSDRLSTVTSSRKTS
jgi:hypothetical protein